MRELPEITVKIIKDLRAAAVDPILYGSQGVSLYIGDFKEFGDIDLLVDQRWMTDDWEKLIEIMNQIGFKLYDLHEHDFVNPESVHASFASKDILVRDNIVQSLKNATSDIEVGDITITTLKPGVFKSAYEFSEQDGYRKNTRGKKDRTVIVLLSEYLKGSL